MLNSNNQKYILGALLVLWAIIQYAAAEYFFMRSSVDTIFYLEGASELMNFRLPEGRGIMYISYMTLLAIIQSIGLQPDAIIYIHFAAELVAIYCAYKLAMKLTNDSWSALLAPLLYVLWFKFQQWNLIIYTDALFSHMVLISVYLIVTSTTIKSKIALVITVTFTIFIRPTGLGLLFAICCLGVYRFLTYPHLSRSIKIVATTLVVILFLFLLNSVLYNFVDRFIYGFEIAEVIYPKITVYIDPPTDLYIPDDGSPIVRLLMFVIMNIGFVLKISAIKVMLFVGHVKPYFSTFHNLFIGLFLYPVYMLAAMGAYKLPLKTPKIIMLSFIFFQIITVMITSENWDGRFLLPLLPLIFVLAAFGLGKLSIPSSICNTSSA